MKIFVKIFLVAIAVSTAIAAIAQSPPYPPPSAAQNASQVAEQTPIPVLLPIPPSLATLTPHTGGSMTGHLAGFTPQRLTLSVDEFSESIPISDIDRLEYSAEEELFISGVQGDRKIRGEQNNQDNLKTWSGVPVSALQLQNPETGEALLQLGSVVSGLELRGLLDIAKTSYFVVREIEFDSPETMTIRALLIDR